MDGSLAAIDFEAFLSVFFPTHKNVFTMEAAIRALADYTGLSQWEASQVVDVQSSDHNLGQMQMYVARLMEVKRGLGEEPRRMTAMLPTNYDALPSPKRHIWENDGCPSPAPIEPNPESKRKICKQFLQSGTCKFGSRCLYHHSKPLRERGYDPFSVKTLPTSSLGITNSCVEALEQLKLSDETQEQKSGFERREVLGVLPSSANNYCTPTKQTKKPLKEPSVRLTPSTKITMAMTMTLQEEQKQPEQQEEPEQLKESQKASEGMTYQAFVPLSNVVMVPLTLPNGDIYGYAPFSLHVTSTHAFTQ